MLVKDKDFWQNLDISVDDILELGKKGSKPPKRLFNKIRETKGWLEVINNVYGKESEDLQLALEELFTKKVDEFYTVFLSAEFGSAVEPDAIRERLPEPIRRKYQTMLDDRTISYEAMVLPIFKADREILQDIFYEMAINRASLKSYEIEPHVDIEEALSMLDSKTLDNFFTKMKKQKVIRRNVKLWWFEFREGKLRIFARLEGVKRKSVHLVDSNAFIRMAGPRIAIFSEGGRRLQVSSRGRDAIARWAGELASDLAKKNVAYLQSVHTFESGKVTEFLNGVVDERIRNIALTEVQKMNFDVDGNPTITIHSPGPEPLNKSIRDLQSNKGLMVITRMDDILSITLTVKGRPYKLTTKTKDDKTTILFDNRNLPETDKDELEGILKKSIVSGE